MQGLKPQTAHMAIRNARLVNAGLGRAVVDADRRMGCSWRWWFERWVVIGWLLLSENVS